jgi:hypothetical protein
MFVHVQRCRTNVSRTQRVGQGLFVNEATTRLRTRARVDQVLGVHILFIYSIRRGQNVHPCARVVSNTLTIQLPAKLV